MTWHRLTCGGRGWVWLLVILAGTRCGVAGEAPPGQWIVVTAPAFRELLAPLCEQRRGQGMHVRVIETTEVLTPQQLEAGEAVPLRDHIRGLCAEPDRPSYVLLVGAVAAPGGTDAADTVVPALRGTIGRMRGRPTDNGYGCRDDAGPPAVAVGRLPARTVAEARAMLDKTLRFERERTPGPWNNRLLLLAGNPGGQTPLERRMAETLIQIIGRDRLARIHPSWRTRAILHARESEFFVPDAALRETAAAWLREGEVFSFYLGHSDATGMWSSGAPFLLRDDWANLEIANCPGVFFTCGCFALQPGAGPRAGYGLAAMRNPGGPVAVIGASGESYGAMGYLTFDAMVQCFSVPEASVRLGDYWLAVTAGLAQGKIDGLTFYVFDQADGSAGRTPLAVQRREHVEMWMLLGDPALRLPLIPAEITLAVEGTASPGASIVVQGIAPAGLSPASVQITLERPLGSPLPPESGASADAGSPLHDRANQVVLVRFTTVVREGQFSCSLELPEALPWPQLLLRAYVSDGKRAACGVLSLPVVVPDAAPAAATTSGA